MGRPLPCPGSVHLLIGRSLVLVPAAPIPRTSACRRSPEWEKRCTTTSSAFRVRPIRLYRLRRRRVDAWTIILLGGKAKIGFSLTR
jgi:hypothetical protein